MHSMGEAATHGASAVEVEPHFTMEIVEGGDDAERRTDRNSDYCR